MVQKTVLIVAPPLATLQDVTGPMEVFCRAESYAPGTYAVRVVSATRDLKVRTKFGLDILCAQSVHDFMGGLDTVLVAGSEEGVQGQADPAFLSWLRAAAARTRRIGSVCTGAFYLAHAGLLAGRRATSHWRYLDRLAAEFPGIAVDAKPIFVNDGEVYTSAGITAGIDLTLALVEADCERRLAQTIARDLVVFVQRQGEQAQLSSALAQRMADREPIREAQQWAMDNLHRVATVADLAAYAHMSARNFARLFKAQTGATPGHYIRQLRVEAAQRRLHELDGAVKSVAPQVGFGSARSLRRSMQAVARASAHSDRVESPDP